MCQLKVKVMPGANFGLLIVVSYVLCHFLRHISTFHQSGEDVFFVTWLSKCQLVSFLRFCLLKRTLLLPLLHERVNSSHSPIQKKTNKVGCVIILLRAKLFFPGL